MCIRDRSKSYTTRVKVSKPKNHPGGICAGLAGLKGKRIIPSATVSKFLKDQRSHEYVGTNVQRIRAAAVGRGRGMVNPTRWGLRRGFGSLEGVLLGDCLYTLEARVLG